MYVLNDCTVKMSTELVRNIQPRWAPALMLTDSWAPWRHLGAPGASAHCSRVLQLVHGSVGAGYHGVTKALHQLLSCFCWLERARKGSSTSIHHFCTAQNEPTQCSHTPLQHFQVGAPMERVGVDILGPSLVLVAVGAPKELHSVQVC